MNCIKDIVALWNVQPESFPDFFEQNPELFPMIDDVWKKENESLVQEFSRKIRKKLRKKSATEQEQQLLEQELEKEFHQFLKKEKILCLFQWMSEELLLDFERETKLFLHKAEAFDKSLSREQIWQALRNYLIYGVIVELQGEVQNAKNPILAYSLLYPYTDNYIDDKRIPRKEKERFNRMIAEKLQGEAVKPENDLEKKTCRLLNMILDEYTGDAAKKVAGTLLELLEAQNRSICQQERRKKSTETQLELTYAQILEISIAKGGASVLADYLFATEHWETDEELFYRKFGLCLQLVDDLQDMKEDGRTGSHTLMTQAQREGRLEAQVNRLLWFIWKVIGAFAPRNPGLKNFVLKYCIEISMVAAVQNAGCFSEDYIRRLEPYLPFTAEFIETKMP